MPQADRPLDGQPEECCPGRCNEDLGTFRWEQSLGALSPKAMWCHLALSKEVAHPSAPRTWSREGKKKEPEARF